MTSNPVEDVMPAPMTKDQAEEFFGEVFGGVHHIPGDVKQFGTRGWKISVYSGQLATYDFNYLTRLVLLAHDRCVRAEIIQGGPGRTGIAIWQRHTRAGDSMTRHPTIEGALMEHRRRYPIETVKP